MNEHDKIESLLSAYLDGELDPRGAQRVQRAIEADDDLARQLDELRAVRGLLHRMPRAAAPDGFVEHVLQRVERPKLVETEQTPAVAGQRLGIAVGRR